MCLKEKLIIIESQGVYLKWSGKRISFEINYKLNQIKWKQKLCRNYHIHENNKFKPSNMNWNE